MFSAAKIAESLKGQVGHESVRGITEAILAAVSRSKTLGIASNPPSGKCKVSNIYFDPVTGKVVCEVDTDVVP